MSGLFEHRPFANVHHYLSSARPTTVPGKRNFGSVLHSMLMSRWHDTAYLATTKNIHARLDFIIIRDLKSSTKQYLGADA